MNYGHFCGNIFIAQAFNQDFDAYSVTIWCNRMAINVSHTDTAIDGALIKWTNENSHAYTI